MTSIWNTQKPSTKKGSPWDTQRFQPKPTVQKEVNTPQPNTLQIEHVAKPLPVFTTIFADHVEFNKYMKQVILEHREKNPEDIQSNVKAWHSSWMTHKENPKFQPLVDRVLSACTFICEGYFQCQKLEFSIFNLWAMMYEKGEHTIRHSHFPSDFSAVYYVDVEPGCAPVIFESKTNNDAAPQVGEPLILQPQNGMLAIWPAVLHHMVPATNGRRMCVSMNVDKYGRTDV